MAYAPARERETMRAPIVARIAPRRLAFSALIFGAHGRRRAFARCRKKSQERAVLVACVHVSKKNPNRAFAAPHGSLTPSPLLPSFPPGPH